jgi:hypothetical protein
MGEISHEIVDFSGEVKWTKLENENYAVDPLYVEEFLAIIG